MLASDKKGLKDLLTTLRKEKVTASAASEEDAGDESSDEDSADGSETEQEEATEEITVEVEDATVEVEHGGDYLDALESTA